VGEGDKVVEVGEVGGKESGPDGLEVRVIGFEGDVNS